MKPTDFSKHIQNFLSRYLPAEKGASINTIEAYRRTFILLIEFMEQEKNINVRKLYISSITRDIVIEFLTWIQVKRKCSDSTRNARLAAIHSFYQFLQYQNIENLNECQQILSIKLKKSTKGTINYLTIEGITLLLKQPDITTRKGRRDLTLLSLMYDTGARVQEIADLKPEMIRLNKPCTIKIIGKGNKARIVPMLDEQVCILKKYITEHKLDSPHTNMYPLFYNSRNEKLTRAGIACILNKYVSMARLENPQLIPDKVSCHSLRHSKAMHLLQAGVPLVYIRDILGHVSIQTTEIYARADSKQKRLAIEKAYVNLTNAEDAKWENNENLLDWLKQFR